MVSTMDGRNPVPVGRWAVYPMISHDLQCFMVTHSYPAWCRIACPQFNNFQQKPPCFLVKSPFSYGFSMGFLIFPMGFPMIFQVVLWFSYGFPMVFLWFSYGFPRVISGGSQEGSGHHRPRHRGRHDAGPLSHRQRWRGRGDADPHIRRSRFMLDGAIELDDFPKKYGKSMVNYGDLLEKYRKYMVNYGCLPSGND